MATQRSSVSSKARYTVDMPPEPRRSSRRKRPLRRVPITGRLFWRLVPVRVRYLTDPACASSWAFEPVIRRLMAEFGDGLVSKVEVNFLRGPSPVAARNEPSLAYAAEKAEFGAARRARWFGL